MDKKNLEDKKSGPRKFIITPIANTVVVKSVKYKSKPDGWIKEIVDFGELGYYFGTKFEPRVEYLQWSPEGVGRGAHLESRSKIISVIFGRIYFCMLDLRPGDDFGKTNEFYLGEGKDSLGDSILVPEGVLNYLVPVGGEAFLNYIANSPYNKFDNGKTLDMRDHSLEFHLPDKSVQHIPEGEETNLMSYQDFMSSLK